MQFGKFSFKAIVLVLVGLASFAAGVEIPAPQNPETGVWIQQVGDIMPHAKIKGTLYYTKYYENDRVKSIDYLYDGEGHLQINAESKKNLCSLDDYIQGSDGIVFHPDGDLLVAGQGRSIHKVNKTAKADGGKCLVKTSSPQSSQTTEGFWHLMMDPNGENLWAAGIPGYLYRFSTKTDPSNNNFAPTGYKVELEPKDNRIKEKKLTTLIWDGEGTAFFTHSDYQGGGCEASNGTSACNATLLKNKLGNSYFGLITDTTWTEVTSENQSQIGGKIGENVITKLGTKILIDSLEGAHGGTYDPYSNSIFVFGGAKIVQIQSYRDDEGQINAKVVATIDMREYFFEESVENLTEPRTSGVGWRLDLGFADSLGHLFVTSNSGHLIFVDYSSNPKKRIDDNVLIHVQWIDNYLVGMTQWNEYVPEETYEVPENTSSDELFGEIYVYDEGATDAKVPSVSIVDRGECIAETNCAQDLFDVVQVGDPDVENHKVKFAFKVKSGLDYEALYNAKKGGAFFNVNLNIRDTEGNETVLLYKISVTDVNEEPYFTNESDVIEIAENASMSPTEIQFADVDKYNTGAFVNNELAIIGGDSDVFEITSGGLIQLKEGHALDYETQSEYQIEVRVRDASVDGDGNYVNPTLQNVKVFKISVVDVNEKPKFKESSYAYSIAEDINVDETNLLGSVAAEDQDAESTISYSLEGDEAALFSINASTGEIFIRDGITFDYETKSSYTFEVVASDEILEDRVSVTVNITDVNEKPIFEEASYEFTVAENAGQTVLGSVVGSDPDADAEITYFLDGEDSEFFVIDPNSGEITTNENATFDYEAKFSYSFEVVASDGFLDARVPVTVNVTNVPEPPVFAEEILNYDVKESAEMGEIVATLTVTDDDCKGEFSESCVKPIYSLSPVVGSEENSDAFTIDSDGNIKVAKNLDYREKSVYEYHVIATDGEDDSFISSADVTIMILDAPNAPRIVDDGRDTCNITENTADKIKPAGYELACYVVEDKDVNQVAELTPSFIDLNSTKASQLFDATIKQDGSLYKLCLVVKDESKLDYESFAHSHKVRISVTDPDNLSASLVKTINIVDVNEKPSISGSLNLFFYEHEGYNSVVGQLYAEDPDSYSYFNDNVFEAVGGDADLFTITEKGLIKTKRDFDYEKESRYTFSLDVSLSDRDLVNYPNYTTLTTVKITLKDSPNDPVESSSSKAVSSSSSKPASSSSKKNEVSSSSSSYRPVASSSSIMVASSSSQFVIEPESSASSSDSNTSEYAYPTFHVRMVAPFEFEIVMFESLPSLAKQYAVMDMKGQVLSVGELNSKETRVRVPTRGAYVVRVGLGYKRVNVK